MNKLIQLISNFIPNKEKRHQFREWYNKKYGNALISRRDVFFENKLKEIKKIWDSKEVVFVYSKKGRFEKDTRLFNNIKNSEEILISPLNAFDDYENI